MTKTKAIKPDLTELAIEYIFSPVRWGPYPGKTPESVRRWELWDLMQQHYGVDEVRAALDNALEIKKMLGID